MKETMVVKIRILAISVVLAGTFACVACSFGPDAYNGPGPCPGMAPPDGVQTDSDCHDFSDAGDDASMGGGDTAGGAGAGTAGADAAGTAGVGTAGAGTAGAGTAGAGTAGGGGSGG